MHIYCGLGSDYRVQEYVYMGTYLNHSKYMAFQLCVVPKELKLRNIFSEILFK